MISIYLKDKCEEKNILHFSLDNLNWKIINNITDKSLFVYIFQIKNLLLNIKRSNTKKYELYINSFSFEDLKSKNNNNSNFIYKKPINIKDIDNNNINNNNINKNNKINNNLYKAQRNTYRKQLIHQSSCELLIKAINIEKKKGPHVAPNNDKFRSKVPKFAQHLPKSIYHVYQYNNKNMGKICAICLDKFIIGKEILTLPCFHFFHVDCISKWMMIKKNCPICLSSII